MARLAALAILAVELGGGFGSATATVVSTTQQSMVVEFHVEVLESADAVVIHLALPGEEPITVPLLPREGNVYGISTEIRPADYEVVFETLGPISYQSQPVTLESLGVELGDEVAKPPEGESPGRAWLWLAVAFGAASLSALAFWVLGARDEQDDDAQEPSEESMSAP